MDETADIREDAVRRLQATIAKDGYRVDAAAVAEAIIRRLTEGRQK
jgi:anti-sigma28 factor (negative regulator of flagellin synthesis)